MGSVSSSCEGVAVPMTVGYGDSGRSALDVLARRPAPLAALIRSERERMRGDQSRVDHEGLDEDQRAGADVGTPPVPPATVD
jgi:hypothetical protein